MRKRRNEQGRISARAAAAIVIMAVFALFLLQNSADVEIKLFFWKMTMPRVFLLLGSLAAGFIAGGLAGWEVFGKKNEGKKSGGRKQGM